MSNCLLGNRDDGRGTKRGDVEDFRGLKRDRLKKVNYMLCTMKL